MGSGQKRHGVCTCVWWIETPKAVLKHMFCYLNDLMPELKVNVQVKV